MVTRHRFNVAIAGLVVLISAVFSAAYGAAAEPAQPITYRQTLTSAQKVELEVPGDLGADIHVVGTTGSSVDVTALPDGSLADSVELNRQTNAQRVQLSFALKGGSVRRWLHLHNTNVKITMHVPRTTKVTVSAVNGSIAVDGIVGPLSVNVVNGPITVKRAGAVLSLNCVNGPIDVGITDVSKPPDVSLNVTNGEIDVTVPKNFRSTVTAHVLMGSVDNNLANTPGRGRLVANAVTGAITITQR